MKQILAILFTPLKNNHLEGFLFDCDCQSYVEQFMIMTFQPKYFLVDPEELCRNSAGNLVYNGLWVAETDVHVENDGRHVFFSLSDWRGHGTEV